MLVLNLRGWRMLFLPAAALVLVFGLIFTLPGSAARAFGSDRPVEVPILMYHSLLREQARSGKYVVSPDLLREDIEYLLENGYTPVTLTELIAYVHAGQSLPEKPVMLTFDDGYLNNLTYLLPLLEEYQIKAVISVVGKYTEHSVEEGEHSPNYAYLHWEDIQRLHASGLVDIQNHSYAFHDQATRLAAKIRAGQNDMSYAREVAEDAVLQNDKLFEHCGFSPQGYAYPHGDVGRQCDELLRANGFLATLGCGENTNLITRDADCLYSLGRFNRPAGLSTRMFMARVLE